MTDLFLQVEAFIIEEYDKSGYTANEWVKGKNGLLEKYVFMQIRNSTACEAARLIIVHKFSIYRHFSSADFTFKICMTDVI